MFSLTFIGQISNLKHVTHENWTEDQVSIPVEYLTSSKNRRLGLLLRPRGKRYWWVMTPEGMEIQVNKYDITFQWPESDKKQYSTQELSDLDTDVENIRTKVLSLITVEKIWESMLVYHKEILNGYDVAKVISMKTSLTLDEKLVYACHRILAGNDIYFKIVPNGWMCEDEESVTKKLNKIVESQMEENLRIKFIEKIKKQLSGENAVDKQVKLESEESEVQEEYLYNEYDCTFLEKISQYGLHGSADYENYEIYEKFLQPLGYGNKPRDAFDLLVDLKIYGKYDNVHVLRWLLDILPGEDLAQHVASETIKMPPPDRFEKIREDFTDVPVFALVNDTEKDLKQFGFSVSSQGSHNKDGKDWVYIHICDPTSYITREDELDIVARKRAMKIFLPENSYEMIPNSIEEIVNFQYMEERNATTVGVRINKDGRIEQYRIFPSKVKKVYALEFSEADEGLLLNKVKDLEGVVKEVKEKYYEIWAKIENIAESRRKFRMKNEALLAFVPKPIVSVVREQDRAIVNITNVPNPNVNSRGIFQELDILAGELIADYSSKLNIPMIYLSQPPIPLDLDFEPTNDPLEDRIKQESLDKLNNKDRQPKTILEHLSKLRKAPRATLTLSKQRHHGYGVSGYANATHPLTSYIDLLNHYQLRAAIAYHKYNTKFSTLDEEYQQKEINDFYGKYPEFICFGMHELQNIISDVEVRRTEISVLEKNSVRFWVLCNIEQDLQDSSYTTYKALVVTAKDDRNETLVIIRKYELEARMVIRRNVVKGEVIYVKVVHVSAFYDRLILKEVPELRVINSGNEVK
eukprot:TRINITY_DN4175_c0_g1_i3.p1 TRINITY_DN4175_c0_g1~~TRINITY_DN4175_c0_g1_i3.p1  ORF type:complete len:806 (-),score=145.08 TRINITY_DN4175_c0_g1_i3:8-2425(-)